MRIKLLAQCADHADSPAMIFNRALPGPAVGREDRVPDLARGEERAVMDVTVENEAAADPRSDPYAQHITVTRSRPEVVLAPHCAVHVVLQDDRPPNFFSQAIQQRKILPVKIWSHENDPIWDVNRTGGSNSDGADFRQRGPCFATGIVDGLDKPVDHIVRASLRLGARVLAADDLVRWIDHDRQHVRAAQIDAHDPLVTGSHCGHCFTIPSDVRSPH